jgi:hypothetical protein
MQDEQIPPAVLLSDNSPLRALPARLDRTQMLVLDGISRSIDMTTLAYRDLRVSLLEQMKSTEQSTSNYAGTVRAVMNAWTIVDAVYRLRVLVRRFRGLRRGPAVRTFLTSAELVKPLRNAVQHLDGEIERLLNDGHPIWGSLSWAYQEALDSKEVTVGLLMPTTLMPPYEIPVVNPIGRQGEIPIGLITLTAAGETICLSDVVATVRRFTVRLERAAEAAFAALPDTVGAEAIFDLPVD